MIGAEADPESANAQTPPLPGLHQLHDVVGSAADPAAVMALAADEASRALGTAAVSIGRFDADGQAITVIVNGGRRAPGQQRFPAGERLRSMSTGDPTDVVAVAVYDPEADPDERERLRSDGRATEVAVVLTVRGARWGELRASTNPGEPPLSLGDRDLVLAVAAELARVIEASEQLAEVVHRDGIDLLTGLRNRRAFDESLSAALERNQQTGAALAVALVDVDGLSRLNDRHGYGAGDDALRRVALVLASAARTQPGSLVARVSGDEFGLAVDAGAVELVELVRHAAQALATGAQPAVTVSCGIAVSARAVTLPELMRTADAAQHLARSGGAHGRIGVATELLTAESMHGGPFETRAAFRFYRDRVWQGVGPLLEEVLGRLDGPLNDAGVVVRLAAVAEACATALRLRRWSISEVPAGEDVVPVLEGARPRSVPAGATRPMAYSLRSASAVQTAVEEERAVLVRAADGDPASAAELSRLGCDQVIVVGARVLNRSYVLEAFGDASSVELDGAVSAVRLLVSEAVHGVRHFS